MPISTTFSLMKEEALKAGKHEFVIDDVNIRTTPTEKGDVSYIAFSLTNKTNLSRSDNLLSAPISLKKQKYNENSKLSTILTRLGTLKHTNDFLSYTEINDLIGKSFEAILIYDDGFPKLDEKTIILHK
jgi:hypothetical protein